MFSTAALLLLVVLAQVCVIWPIRDDQRYLGWGLKETGAKTEHVTQGDTGQYDKTDVSSERWRMQTYSCSNPKYNY